MFNVNIYKIRSRVLNKLGLQNYTQYLRSPWFLERKRKFAATVAPFCFYCSEPADDLHHLSYKHLGDEPDAELRWVCRRHHAEIHDRGFIGLPTSRMKEILFLHGYPETCVNSLTFGDAFDLIGRITKGTVTTPIMLKKTG